MKLIIIEGTDNTGKDTLISKLLEKYPTSTLIHCGKPCSSKFSDNEQDKLFNTYASNIVLNTYKNTHVIIMNRSHIGEYVYGVMYRNRNKDEVRRMIENIDRQFINCKDLEVYYVQMLCSSEYLLHKNEDSKSLSNGNVDKINEERKLFEEIFQSSILNKHIIYVNNGDNFRSREEIFNEVWKFVNN